MSFRNKILLVLVAMGLLPIALLGWAGARYSGGELLATVDRMLADRAAELARTAESFVDDGLKSLRLAASYIPLDELSAQELRAVLEIPYRQLPALDVVVALDAAGNALAEPVFTQAEPAPAPRGRGVTPEDLAVFSRHVPLEPALQHGMAIGPPYRSSRGASVALAVRAGRGGDRVLAAALSLEQLQRGAERIASGMGVAYLTDAKAAAVVWSEPLELGAGELALVRERTAEGQPEVRRLQRAGGGEWVAAYAPAKKLGWGAVVAQPLSEALRGPERVHLFSLFWACAALVLIGALGIYLSRSFHSPVRALSEGARALTEGRYDFRLQIDSRDEMGQLAEAFNHMAAEIERRNDEIRRWNEELQQRVEQRSAELEEAQEQILRTRRLTALGSMSAGVVHELNNPMTGLLGLVQLAQRQLAPDAATAQMLDKALQQGKRVTRILDSFKQFAEQEQETAGRRFSIETAVKSALELYRAPLEAAKVSVETEVASNTPDIVGDWVQIGQLLGNLVQNAVDAMPSGGSLSIRAQPVGGEAVKIVVADSGLGIPAGILERVFDPFYTTKQQTKQIGMGLTICHRIVEAHHGRISLHSEEGRGTTVEIYLPAAPAAAHLV